MALHTQDPHGQRHGIFDAFGISRGRLIAALVLIALGMVFFLGQSGQLDYGSPWWVLFIAIPGVVTLGGAVRDYIYNGRMTSTIVSEVVFGIAALLLSAIFVWDPTWSFTRGWSLDKTFPFLRDMDKIWPWLVVAAGAVLFYRAYTTRTSGPALIGTVLVIVGGVFILDISWNTVWPLLIVAAGVWLLVARHGDAE